MRASVTNSGGIAALQKSLQRVSKREWQKPLYERIGARLHKLVDQGWEKRAAPDGAAWAPTGRSNPVLEELRDMRGSTKHEVVSNGITLKVDDWKAAFHQYGTSRGIVPRKMLPEGQLPAEWVEAIQEEADAFFAEWFKG